MSALNLFAQEREGDLRARLEMALNEAERLETLLALSTEVVENKPDEALVLARQALQIAQKEKHPLALAKSCIALAAAYSKKEAHRDAGKWLHEGLKHARQGKNDSLEITFLTQLSRSKRLLSELDSAIQFSQEALTLQERTGIRSKVSNNYFEIGVAYDLKGELDAAVSNLLLALEEAERSQEDAQIALVLNSLGIVNRSARNYEKALDYYQQAQKIYEKLNDRRSLGNILHNIGDLYLNQGDFENGLAYTLQGKAIREKLNDYYGLAYSYQNLAYVYFYHLKDYRQALQADGLAFEMRERIGDKGGMAASLNDMGWDLFSLGNTSEAFEKSKEALEMARRLGARAIERNCLELLAQIAATQGQYQEAMGYQQQFYELKDSLFNAEKNQVIQELQLKYETAQKERQLQENQLVIARRTIQRNWLLAAAILTGLLALSVFFGFRNRLRYNQRLAAQSAELQAQRIRELEQNQKIIALDAMMQGQEEERARVAKDLHDGLGGLLSSIKHHFRAVREQHSPIANLPVFNKTDAMLDQAHEEVRRIAHDMMPDALSKLGLLAAVEDQAAAYHHENGIKISVQNLGWNGQLEASQEIMLFRIIQELLQNIAKHAQATEVFIQFSRYDQNLVLTIEDNGIGFDLEKAKAKGGMGLKSIESRTAYLNGNLEVETRPGKGTVSIVQIPG